MNLKSFAAVYAIQMTFLFVALKPFPLEQLGALALALTVLTMGGTRLLKPR